MYYWFVPRGEGFTKYEIVSDPTLYLDKLTREQDDVIKQSYETTAFIFVIKLTTVSVKGKPN